MPAWLSILVRAGKRKITCCWTAHEEGSRRPRGDVNVRKTVRAHTDSRGNGRAGAPTRKFGLVVPAPQPGHRIRASRTSCARTDRPAAERSVRWKDNYAAPMPSTAG